MAKKRELPNLENATPSFLIDAIAEQREIQKDAKFLEGVYKEALESRRDKTKTTVEGDKYTGMYESSQRESVISDAVRAAFPPAENPQYYQVTPVTTLRIVAKEQK